MRGCLHAEAELSPRIKGFDDSIFWVHVIGDSGCAAAWKGRYLLHKLESDEFWSMLSVVSDFQFHVSSLYTAITIVPDFPKRCRAIFYHLRLSTYLLSSNKSCGVISALGTEQKSKRWNVFYKIHYELPSLLLQLFL
jgi:hypothetical protein